MHDRYYYDTGLIVYYSMHRNTISLFRIRITSVYTNLSGGFTASLSFRSSTFLALAVLTPVTYSGFFSVWKFSTEICHLPVSINNDV